MFGDNGRLDPSHLCPPHVHKHAKQLQKEEAGEESELQGPVYATYKKFGALPAGSTLVAAEGANVDSLRGKVSAKVTLLRASNS